jgi:hypothetical protein
MAKKPNVDAILAKYGFTSGRPQVQEPKNLDFAKKAFVKALIASGYNPVEVEDKLFFSNGKISVGFLADKWEVYKGKELIEASHFGKGSINLVRWIDKHA